MPSFVQTCKLAITVYYTGNLKNTNSRFINIVDIDILSNKSSSVDKQNINLHDDNKWFLIKGTQERTRNLN